MGERRRLVAVRVGVPGVAVESVGAGTEPVAGLAGAVAGFAGALASGSCGVRGVSGMKTGADLRETGGGEEVRRSDAVGERLGPVGGFAAAGIAGALVVGEGAAASAWVLPNAGGSGPVDGRDVVAGAGSGVVGGRVAAGCCGRMEVGGRAGGICTWEVGGLKAPPGGVMEPVGRLDMPVSGGSGSVVGRELCVGVRVGALEKTGGVTLPEGTTGGSARVGGRGGAGCVVRCS